MMDLLPRPDDFQARLKAAVLIEDANERLNKLSELAQHQLSYVDMIQLDKVLLKLSIDLGSEFIHVRLAILTTCTIDHLIPAIRIAGLRKRLLIEVYAGAYGQYRQELLDKTSLLYEFNPEVVVFSLTAEETISNVPLSASVEMAEAAVSQAVNDLSGYWKKAQISFNATVVQQSFLDVSEPIFGSYDRHVPGSPAYLISRLNHHIAEASHREKVLFFDITRASARDGIDAWFDITRWLQGKIEIAPQAAASYGEILVRLIAAQRGLSKKCLVLDLDNTLWGGVIGDDGLEGIILGEGSAQGEAYLRLQSYVKTLNERGIILAVCSKNDTAIAESAFTDHPEMLLKRSDIAVFMANWNDKVENLQQIAKHLNIGLDSLVFIDDNPVERDRVRKSLPVIAVPELPDDAAYYVRCIANSGYFEANTFTAEDQQRAVQYAANIERESLQNASQDMDDFLRSLDMSVVYGPMTALELGRVTQLFNKTNQFNTTTRRYTAEEITALSYDPKVYVLQFRLTDRFGDNGLVSAIILSNKGDVADILEIENWVMSCRVFGRQLEYEIMNIVVESAKSRGINEIRANFIPTKKNSVINGLFEKLGFSCEKNDKDNNITRWIMRLVDYINKPTSIAREE